MPPRSFKETPKEKVWHISSQHRTSTTTTLPRSTTAKGSAIHPTGIPFLTQTPGPAATNPSALRPPPPVSTWARHLRQRPFWIIDRTVQGAYLYISSLRRKRGNLIRYIYIYKGFGRSVFKIEKHSKYVHSAWVEPEPDLQFPKKLLMPNKKTTNTNNN